MEKLSKKDFEKESGLFDEIKQKLNEQVKNLKKITGILEQIKDIGTNIGKENARVMFDVKYEAELKELSERDKKLVQEIKDLEERLRVL